MIETTLFSQNGTLSAGQTIRRYRLVRPIGQGGMAEVWLAVDTRPQMHNRAYAIKFAHLRTPEDTERRARFRRELQTLIQLQHGHIVGVIDTDAYENSPYLVMEYLPGGTLADIQHPIGWKTAVRALAPIAHALTAAHQGVTVDDKRVPVVHRDVKPSNILIRSQSPELDLVITDFGIVRFTEAVEGATAQFYTAEAQRIGTLAYMSPEQLLGEEITPKSDVFSLAVVLYELITGQRPFESDSLKVVAAALAIQKPMPDPRKKDKSIPAGLVQLLKKALAYDAQQRISMTEFAAQLDRLKMGESLGEASSRMRWVVGGMSVMGVISCIGVLVVAAWIGMQRNQAPEPIVMAGQATEISQIEMNNPATATPTLTPTLSVTPIPTENIETTENAVVAPFDALLLRGSETVNRNEDWTPVGWVFEDDPINTMMMLVPSGCFSMGSNGGESDERPLHTQCFNAPFFIDQTEATRQQWQVCVDAGVCRAKTLNEFSSTDNQPINFVSWFDAVAFCNWRNGRLPTEREWEYAAVGPSAWAYPWGNSFNSANVVYELTSGGISVEVGSRPSGASWVGALDMSGNLWEWVSSKYFDYPYSEFDGRENPQGNEGRVFRGGSFRNPADLMRVAFRGWDFPSTNYRYTGVRCVREP